MLNFYHESRSKYFAYAFTKPYATRSQPSLDSVRTNSIHLQKLASAYERKETHVVHEKIDRLRIEHAEIKRMLSGKVNCLLYVNYAGWRVTALLSITKDHSSLTSRQIGEVQTALMIQAANSKIFADPNHTLLLRVSLPRRLMHRKKTCPGLTDFCGQSVLVTFDRCLESQTLLIERPVNRS